MDRRELRTILGNWNIGDLVSLRQATKGVVNVNWIVKTTKGRYVLKGVAQFAEACALEFEMKYLIFLKEHGCDEVQGSLFGLPVTGSEFAQSLDDAGPALQFPLPVSRRVH